ncbi:MAG: flagellar assembly protein FliW [Deltaproteobacteria bacterium]|nr:flagellar assembly protein FliW [Deltaproteobacteria bacterium]
MKAAQNLNREGLINVITTRFGTVPVAEEKVINFVHGIPGFEKLRRFILIDHDKDGIFRWLQSTDEPGVAFLLTDPNIYKPGYTVPLRKSQAEELGAAGAEGCIVMVMVSASEASGQVSLNLKGPVVFNSINMKAMQCIVDREDYPVNYPVKF